MALFADLKGTTQTTFQIGAALLKRITGGVAFRNTADSADEKVQASQFEATGNTGIIFNADAAGSGADWTITLNRPATGMTGSYTLTWPIDDGSPNQNLTTDGAGNMSWQSSGTTADCIKTNRTTVGFGTASPVSMLATPSGTVISKIQVIIDTPFNGTPTLTVGIAGQTAKYMGATQNVLTGVAADTYESNPSLPSTAGESLIATYSAGGASAGSARVLVYYSVPA